MNKDSEKLFSQAVQHAMDTAWSNFKLRFPRLEQMRKQNGDLATAKKLLRQNGTSDGLTKLFLEGATHLSIESIALEDEFSDLFTPEELVIARQRLGR